MGLTIAQDCRRMRLFSIDVRRALLMVALAAAGTTGAHASERRAVAPVTIAQIFDDETDAPTDRQQPNSAAALTVRIDRMEGTIRTLTGQIEELQFQNRKLTDDLRKMQQDVDFRFQDLNRAGGTGTVPPKPASPPALRKSELDVPAGTTGLPMDASGASPVVPAGEAPLRPTRRVGDAFDPDANPNAPGAPRQLGTTPTTPPLPNRSAVGLNNPPSEPLDLMKRATAARPAEPSDSTENGVAAIPVIPAPAEALRPAANPNAVASLAPGGTRDEYSAVVDLYKQGQYDAAANGLKGFLDRYPRDRLVPDAVYLLGQSYTRLGRHREAAEQYLRLSTDFSKAPRAPDALLRLGMSLDAMGVREQACATFQEVTRRFPAASADVRSGVDRELKRARC